MRDLIVSVHLPKTAGTTLKDLLLEVSAGNCFFDYGDMPLSAGYEQRRSANRGTDMARIARISGLLSATEESTVAIHGHFVADKYDSAFPQNKSAVWFRDPAQRIASHYHYWKRIPDPKNSICAEMLDRNMSLEDFFSFEPMRNIYARFLSAKPVGEFAFVGITEEFDKSLRLFEKVFKHNIRNPLRSRNSNPNAPGSGHALGARAAELIDEHHALDVNIYQQALSRFKDLCKEYGV